MGKKILIITGSPRADGNTNTLVGMFMGGAVAAGNEVEVIDAVKYKIYGCYSDYICQRSGECPIDDDMKKIHELMRWADVLVLASPVYWGSFTSHIKRIIDRFTPYLNAGTRRLCTIRETYFISAAMTEDPEIFSCITTEYQNICKVLKFESRGMLLAPGLRQEGDAKAHPELLQQAVSMGFNV